MDDYGDTEDPFEIDNMAEMGDTDMFEVLPNEVHIFLMFFLIP